MNLVSSFIRRSVRSVIHSMGYDLRALRSLPEVNWLGLKRDAIHTVLDIGANRGQFASRALKAFPGAKIVSVEPLPGPFEQLQRVAEKSKGRLRAFHLALGAPGCAARADFFEHTEHSLSSSFLDTTAAGRSAFAVTRKSQVVSVDVKTMDDFVSSLGALRNDVLIKMDVQGFEERVCSGGLNTMKRAHALIAEINIVSIYEGQTRFRDLLAICESAGLHYAGNVEQVCDGAGKVLWIDALFVRG